MTRWLLLVLMVLLPAQFSWAAAAPYCAHESQPTSFHVGHHAHVHEGASADAPQASPEPGKAVGLEAKKSEKAKEAPRGPLLAADHADCHYCHAAAGQPASCATPRFERPARDVFVAFAVDALQRDRENRIERPKWTRAA